jgi:large subunit ribosomal protein L19
MAPSIAGDTSRRSPEPVGGGRICSTAKRGTRPETRDSRAILRGRRVLSPDPKRHLAATAAQLSQEPRVNVLDEIVQDQLRTDLPELATGDTVKVSAKVIEGTRERVQVFEGTVMRLRGGGITRSITVRRIASGVGVERTFKINSPRIEKIEVVRHGVARRAQLYFLRDRVGKAATLRERRTRS